MAKKKAALGKGLGALIEDTSSSNEGSDQQTQGQAPKPDNYINIPVEAIANNPHQPRSNFNDESLEELAESIKRLGIIQPITIQKPGDENAERFHLISGERRVRAAKIAGLRTIPAFIRKADDQTLLEYALVENIQREDLNAMDVAINYKRLIEEIGLTQDNLSKRIGKKRATITNYLRLLKLPPEIQAGLRDRKITMGHARALINIEDPTEQIRVFLKIVKEGLSVRKVEELVSKMNKPGEKRTRRQSEVPERHREKANNLSSSLDAKIEVKRGKSGKGKIVIPFSSDEDFDRLVELMNKINHEE